MAINPNFCILFLFNYFRAEKGERKELLMGKCRVSIQLLGWIVIALKTWSNECKRTRDSSFVKRSMVDQGLCKKGSRCEFGAENPGKGSCTSWF